MSKRIVHSDKPITLIGGGYATSGDLELALRHGPLLVAADGGAGAALGFGHVPHAVIGDFDSLQARDRAALSPDTLFPIPEQNSTDFDKALRSIAAPLVLGVGFLGGRVDHQLAAFSTLVRRAAQPCVLIGETELVFHLPSHCAVDLAEGDVVSLFPFAQTSGRSQGLVWPIDGLAFSPAGQIGTSNRATGRVEIEMDGPGLLAIVPRRALSTVMRSIASTVPV